MWQQSKHVPTALLESCSGHFGAELTLAWRLGGKLISEAGGARYSATKINTKGNGRINMPQVLWSFSFIALFFFCFFVLKQDLL